MLSIALSTDLSQQPRGFAGIFNSLRPFGLWAFPVGFEHSGNGRIEKRPLVRWGEVQERPPTQKELDQWYLKPNATGAGIPTGEATGIFVVDTDSIEGEEYMARRDTPATWRVRTRHGCHDYFRYADFLVRNKVQFKNWPFPFDIRGAGGFVVAAGSVAPGFMYYWVEGCSPADLPLADAPEWLLSALRECLQREVGVALPQPPRPYRGKIGAWAKKAFDANIDVLRNAAQGTRNQTFWDVGRRLGQLCAGGELDSGEVLATLNEIADGWPISAHSRDTIARAFKAGQAQPKTAPPKGNIRRSIYSSEDPPGAQLPDSSFYTRG